MIEKKFIISKKQELEIKEFVEKYLEKGKVSNIRIGRTPIGEKIIISTTKPGRVVGRGGEIIQKISKTLKDNFQLENPQIDIEEVQNPDFDAPTIADNIALSLERFGPISFKLVAYKALDRLVKSGALGAEIRLSGKLPGERAKSWRFAFGYLKKTGSRQFIVKKAKALAFTKPGVVGVKVSIVPKGTKLLDKIEIKQEEIEKILAEKIEQENQKVNKTK